MNKFILKLAAIIHTVYSQANERNSFLNTCNAVTSQIQKSSYYNDECSGKEKRMSVGRKM